MKYYTKVDEQGFPTQFWNDDVFPPQDDETRNLDIPHDAFEISESDYIACLTNQGKRKIINGIVEEFVPPEDPPQRIVSSLEFLALFTPGEQLALLSSADANIRLSVWKWSAVPAIDLLDNATIAGVNYLAVAANPPIINAARAATILSGKGPT